MAKNAGFEDGRWTMESSKSVRNSNQQHCLFCLQTLLPPYNKTVQQGKVLPSGDILGVSLNDPVKNLEGFELLCNLLLGEKWKSPRFDPCVPLPLCVLCQNLYQDVIQVHQQIRQLEALLNSQVEVIKGKISISEIENSGKRCKSQLEIAGLDVFRREVMNPTSTSFRNDTATADVSEKRLSDYLSVEIKEEVDADGITPTDHSLPDGEESPPIEEDTAVATDVEPEHSESEEEVLRKSSTRTRRLPASVVESNNVEEDDDSHTPQLDDDDGACDDNSSSESEEIDSVTTKLPHKKKSPSRQGRTKASHSRVVCQVCSRSYHNVGAFQRHNRDKHDGQGHYRILSSEECFTPPVSKPTPDINPPTALYACSKCDKSFIICDSFSRHNRTKHGGKAVYKHISNPTPDLVEQAQNQLSRYTTPKKCHICGEGSFSNKVSLQQHVKEVHPDHKGGVLTCQCGKKFRNYDSVFEHDMRKHLKEKMVKSFQCEQCPMLFFTLRSLTVHCASHLPVEDRKKENICSICGAGCSTPGNLRRHLRDHELTDEDKHVCDVCGKGFKREKNLRLHVNSIHLNIRPYKCPTCGKGYPLPSLLSVHKCAYKCGWCGRVFQFWKELAKHRVDEHNVPGEGHLYRKKKKKMVDTPKPERGGETGVHEGHEGTAEARKE